MAERTGRLIAGLVASIQKTAGLVQEVAAASEEQATGVRQIDQAMASVDQVTQRGAAASEELSSTAEELASQAESLQELMGFFKLSGDRPPAPRPPSRSLRPEPPRRPPAGRPSPLDHGAVDGFRRFPGAATAGDVTSRSA